MVENHEMIGRPKASDQRKTVSCNSCNTKTQTTPKDRDESRFSTFSFLGVSLYNHPRALQKQDSPSSVRR